MTPELIRRLRETIMPGMQVLRDKCFVNGAHTHAQKERKSFLGEPLQLLVGTHTLSHKWLIIRTYYRSKSGSVDLIGGKWMVRKTKFFFFPTYAYFKNENNPCFPWERARWIYFLFVHRFPVNEARAMVISEWFFWTMVQFHWGTQPLRDDTASPSTWCWQLLWWIWQAPIINAKWLF